MSSHTMEPIHVLVVDDEAELLETVSLVLSMEHYRVTRTTDPHHALALLRQQASGDARYDLLVTDLNMPGLSGLELLRQARAAGADLPVLAITAYGSKATVVELLREGVGDYVDKPFPVAELCQRVRVLAEKACRLRGEATGPDGHGDATLGRLAGGVLHDIQNSLTIILASAELLVAHPPGELPAAKEDLADILKAATLARDSIRRFQALARGWKWREPQPMELHEVVRDTVSLASASLRGKLALHLDLRATATWAEGERVLLANAILNLLFNALDAMPGPGNLWIGTENQGKDHIMITVRDDGAGMSEETQARLFKPGFSTKGRRGNGLGLAMVKKCVEQHGGIVELTSALGVGTEFRIVLPAAASAAHLQTAITKSVDPSRC